QDHPEVLTPAFKALGLAPPAKAIIEALTPDAAGGPPQGGGPPRPRRAERPGATVSLADYLARGRE
ncbi:hypothetical protein ACWGN4_32685, partial [Streptomyces massasporeus]